MPLFTRGAEFDIIDIGSGEPVHLDPQGWRRFAKRTTTPAIRIDGPFSVKTREGTITCEDGWLAVDSGGWPYPIAADEFDRIYAQVTDGE